MLIWDDIRYFLALARAGSLSGASRMLGVEHSTVARRMGQLEEALDAKLFDRFARGWTLTSEGMELLQKAQGVEREVTAFRRTASGMDALTGTVRITAPPLMLSHLIMPHVGAVTEAHPGLTLELVGERREADLARAEADIAVRLGEPSEPNLVIRHLGAISYGLYGLPHQIERSKLDRIYIGFDDSMPDLPQKSWLEAHAEGCRISIRTNDMSTMLEAALAGLGVALLPEFLARPHDRLVALEVDVPTPFRPLYLVMHPDIRRARRVQIVADQLSKVLIPTSRKRQPRVQTH